MFKNLVDIYINGGKQLFALNFDGTEQGGSYQVKIPDSIIDFPKNEGVIVPRNNLREWLNLT